MPSEGKKCPKCGNDDDMTPIILPQRWMAPIDGPVDAYVCGNCGHEEKVSRWAIMSRGTCTEST